MTRSEFTHILSSINSLSLEQMQLLYRELESKLVEKGVQWRVLDQTLAEVREKFADVPPDALQAMIDDAVRSTCGETAIS